MKCFFKPFCCTELRIFVLIFVFLFSSRQSFSQTYDTISNWDGITQDWYFSAGSGMVVFNPAPDAVNSSARCLKVVTTSWQWDHFSYVLPEPVNFDAWPRYKLKVLAPSSGGSVTMKFENANNTYFHEITATPSPGQWSELSFDFSGLNYDNLTRMVIFYDFQGSTAFKNWYFDDIVREIPQFPSLSSNLPIVVINTFNVAVPDEPKIDAVMGIIDNGPGQTNHSTDPFNNYNGNIGIETRGQSTQMFPKKSYALETRDNQGENLDVSLLGFPEENDWILYAPYTDKSLMRNVITFELTRRTGHYVTRTKYCELILNNDYKGIYVLEEKIKKDENRVDIATLKPDEISGNDLTGGYILRVDKRDSDFAFGIDGWQSNPVPAYAGAMDIIFQYYYPEPDKIVAEQRNYIKDYVTLAENTLTSQDFKNPETGYQQYFDVASFIDFMLICEISKEVDKYRYSTYFFKKKNSDGGKLHAGPAWDFNLGYGNVDYWPPGNAVSGWLYEMVEPYEWSIMFWWKRLMEDPYFKGLAKIRWQQLRQEKFSYNSVQAVIDSVVSHTAAARDRNFNRWPILGQYVWPNYDWYGNTYTDELNNFRSYLFNRMNWMDNNFDVNAVPPAIAIMPLANTLRLTVLNDYFATNQLESSSFTLNNAPNGLSIQTVTYVSANECLLTLSANVANLSDLSVTLNEKAINSWENLTSNTVGTAGLPHSAADYGVRIKKIAGNWTLISDQPQTLPAALNVFDITGRNVQTIQLQQVVSQPLQFDIHSGSYFIRIEMKEGNYVQKIIYQ